MKKIFFGLSFIALSVTVFSQQRNGNWCGTDYMMQKKLTPALLNKIENDEENLRKLIDSIEKTSSGTVQIVPVVVHVIHDNGNGNITEEQIKDGIRVLNEDFVRLNADTVITRDVFKPYAGIADFEFRLAQIDPSGNPTNGIVRVNSQQTYDANDNTKSLSYWNSSKYFNIWLVNSIEGSGGGSVILGYAQFPGWGNWDTYGVIMLHTQFGRIGTSYSEGRTTTHEVGHCFNLYHTFEGGCGNSCGNSGDRVCDTPPTANSTQGCSTNQNLCSNDAGGNSPYTTDVVDQIENYMSYDDCQNMFSAMQVSRMKAAISNNEELLNLISETNLTATGVDVLSAANFISYNNIICTGDSIKFYDDSYYGQTGWAWNFSGANPPASTEQNPAVVYYTPGLYNVSLTVTNGVTTKSITKENYVYVISSEGSAMPFSESFESISLPNNRWFVVNQDKDTSTFQIDTTTAYSGNSCVKLNNETGAQGNRDELIAGSFDFSTMSAVTVTFKAAYAQKDTSTKDKWQVFISTDCGNTWGIRYAKVGSALASVPAQTALFTPADTSQWNEHSFTLSSSQLQEGALIKFVFESDAGNNFYIDDINITGTYNPIPVLKSPIDGAINQSDNVKVDWKAVGGVSSYYHLLDTTPLFNSSLLDIGTHNYISPDPDGTDTEHQYANLIHSQKYYWKVRTITGSDTSAWSTVWNFTVSDNGIGINEIADLEILIYPNPNNGKFQISNFQFPISKIEIYNVLGEKVFAMENGKNTLTINPFPLTIDLSNHPKGLYFLKISSDNFSAVKKFVVE